MTLHLIPIGLLISVLDIQQKDDAVYKNEKDGNQIRPDTITRDAITKDGKAILSTSDEAFPEVDGAAERVENIFLGKNKIGEKIFLVTAQNKGWTLSDDIAALEANKLEKLLKADGSHYGTAAIADLSFDTMGIAYVVDDEGFKEQFDIPGMKKAFVAGKNDGQLYITVETTDRFAILPAMIFMDRVNNGGQLILESEGRAKKDGETLVPAELDTETDTLVMAVRNGSVKFYGIDGKSLDKTEDGVVDNVYHIPAVDMQGMQTKSVVRVTKTGDESGTVERMAANG